MLPVYEPGELGKLLGIEEIEKDMRRGCVRVCMFFIIPFVIIEDAIKQLLRPKVKRKKTENER